MRSGPLRTCIEAQVQRCSTCSASGQPAKKESLPGTLPLVRPQEQHHCKNTYAAASPTEKGPRSLFCRTEIWLGLLVY